MTNSLARSKPTVAEEENEDTDRYSGGWGSRAASRRRDYGALDISSDTKVEEETVPSLRRGGSAVLSHRLALVQAGGCAFERILDVGR
jgi:hypothetical protein